MLFPHVFPMAEFLLTRLLRGVTEILVYQLIRPRISTHTPLARRDPFKSVVCLAPIDFYSHASCEA